jgi:hypothetical protein
VCADLAFGLRARIEGWSTRPKERRKRKEKKRKLVLASHHHRKSFLFGRAGRANLFETTFPLAILREYKSQLEKMSN